MLILQITHNMNAGVTVSLRLVNFRSQLFQMVL